MNEFTFEESPWELTLSKLPKGGSLPAVQFLTLMEGEEETSVEDALLDLEDRRIGLNLAGFPRAAGTGEAAVRLRREAQLVKQGTLLSALEENDPLRLYLEELASIPACGDPEVLALECLEGKPGAAEQLLNVSLSRVIELAKAHTGYGVLLLDLIQEGSLGLWQGILSYREGDFKVHVRWWIQQYLARAITLQAKERGVGQKMKQAMEDFRAVDGRLLTELGRNATLPEIADAMHMTLEETQAVAGMLESARMLENAKPEEKEEDPQEENQAVEDTAYFQLRQRVSELLGCLDAEEAKLLTLRFGLEGGLPLSPEEIGKMLGITPEDVVAREAAALNKLRNQ